MAIKIFQETDTFMTQVDATAHAQGQVKEIKYYNTPYLKFEFNGDVCTVIDQVTNTAIISEDVTDIQNEAGDLTQTKAGVEAYLLSFIGG